MMKKTGAYWIGPKPSDGKRWAYAEHATVINDPALLDSVLHMHRRYIQQWNDIELNLDRSLQEHLQEVCDAHVVGASRMFVLHDDTLASNNWILEVKFARGFSPFHPGMSCGKNPLRSMSDIANVRLHWGGAGDQCFREWLEREHLENSTKTECTAYKK